MSFRFGKLFKLLVSFQNFLHLRLFLEVHILEFLEWQNIKNCFSRRQVSFLPGRNRTSTAPMIGIIPKTIGGSQCAVSASPVAINGAIIDPTRASIEAVPMATLRITVGKSSPP